MTTVEGHITTLRTHAETIRQDAPHDISTIEPGDQWCQGDVRVVRLPDDFGDTHAAELTAIRNFTGQVAPGTSLGSRHVLANLATVRAYTLTSATSLDGPVVHVLEPTHLTHPEHGDCCNLPTGWYAFPGQRVYADEVRRVAD